MAQGIKSTVSRRTVAKGIAWSVPAVAMATAAPAFASSCEYTLVIDPTLSCKKANTNDYRLVFKVGVTAQGPAHCVVPDDYTATITKVYESTGQGGTLWEGYAETPASISICNTDNMSAWVMVTATFPDGTRDDIQVKMPNFNSIAPCDASDFVCPATTQAPTSTEESAVAGQADEPVASTEQTEEPTAAAEVPAEEPAADEVQVEAQTEAPAEQPAGEEATED